MTKPLTFLALGDSYTIGESVPLRENFPYQTVSMLRQKGFDFTAPEIVATTGWTTDELEAGIKQHTFLKQYDLVTLLIGVNNQYRGRPLEQYRIEFTHLLQQALNFTGNNNKKVVVLSIPDYGVTPFAKNRNPQKIGQEIDAFNAAAKEIADKNGVAFIDITVGSRAALHQPELIAADGLHPSGNAYRQWSEKLVEWIQASW